MPISPLLLLLLLFSSSLSLLLVDAARTADGSEEWGYVQVRPRAHMFWWLYRSPQRVDNGSAPWPTVLWLQGGPGGSGVGIGNFQEIGPVDANLQPRSTTWLQKADLLFVDNPVGTGYSFVEDESLFVKSDWEAATDLTTLLKNLYHEQASSWQNSPLFIVAESYGGKFAVTAGLSIAQAIRAGKLKLNLGGVALGDSWISPEDFVLSWAPLLLDLSRIDIIDAEKSSIMAEKIREEIKKEQYGDATNSWGELEEFIVTSSNDVDFYNFLLDSGSDPVSLTAAAEASRKLSLKMYPTYLSSKASTSLDISGLMNGVIKEKLKIIPKNVSWGGQSGLVFDSLSNDFMKPRINEVDELLSLGINVTIYNGQVDLICATKGTEAWVQKLKWDGLKNFNSMDRKPIYCSSEEAGVTKGFLKSYQNLHFYWILGAGHFSEHMNMFDSADQSPKLQDQCFYGMNQKDAFFVSGRTRVSIHEEAHRERSPPCLRRKQSKIFCTGLCNLHVSFSAALAFGLWPWPFFLVTRGNLPLDHGPQLQVGCFILERHRIHAVGEFDIQTDHFLQLLGVGSPSGRNSMQGQTHHNFFLTTPWKRC